MSHGAARLRAECYPQRFAIPSKNEGVSLVSNDPRATIAAAAMSPLQVIIVVITIALNALDGFDVLAISFASPGIANEWHINPLQLGTVLSMELLGMAIGSIVLGGVADKVGRRRTILGCLVVMAAGMFMATGAQNTVQLSVWRILTGLGIGGLLAAINAVTAEFSNARRRHLNVSLMSIGYPIGAVVGGTVAAQLLRGHDWRSVFYFGASITAVLIPIVFFLVPESVQWLARRQPAGALEKINRTLVRIRQAPIDALPVISPENQRRSVGDIFSPGLIAITVILSAAYFFHVTTFYFVLKWLPRIVNLMGFAPSAAAGVLVWANVGGALGGAVFGLLTQRVDLKRLTIVTMVLSTVMVVIFGRSPPDLHRLSLICACSGFFTNAAIVGMYAIFAQAYPTHVRAFGTGWAIGIGRGGSVLAPILAGFLFNEGYGVPIVAFAMAFGSLIAAGILSMLKLRPDQPAAETLESPALTSSA
jgi:benzoate transport